MGGRACALQGVPFQAWALSASPAQASATFSLELCLMSPSHQSSGGSSEDRYFPLCCPSQCPLQAPRPRWALGSRVPDQTEGPLEWEAAKLPGHPQPDPTPASPTGIRDPCQPDCNLLQSYCVSCLAAPLLSAGYPPPCMPSTPQAGRTAGAEGLGKEELCLQN